MQDCIFCKIIKKQIPADLIYEDQNFIVFKDIKPKAPVHILLVPKKHIKSVNELKSEDKNMMGELFIIAQKVADQLDVKNSGYKLVFNVGRGGGQLVDHIHLHLIAGWDNKEQRDIPGMP